MKVRRGDIWKSWVFKLLAARGDPLRRSVCTDGSAGLCSFDECSRRRVTYTPSGPFKWDQGPQSLRS